VLGASHVHETMWVKGLSQTLGYKQKAPCIFEDLGVDFIEVKPCGGYWYILVLLCTCWGWVEAYPPHTQRAREVVKTLLREIIPRYGLPLSIGSENGPAFVAEIVQGLAKILFYFISLFFLNFKNKMEVPYSIQASEFREHTACESNPQNYLN
jgi:hypothetical protein